MAGGTFPTTIPAYTATAGSDTANAAAGGTGLSPLLNQYEVDVTALATKMGTGVATPTSGKLLRGNGTGTSTWGQLIMASDVAAFSSADILGVVSDETGTGSLVFNSSPTIVTPTIASFTNAQHNHSNAAGGGKLTGSTAITDGTIIPASLMSGTGSSWSSQSWTPTWTNLTVSGSTVTALYNQIGKDIFFNVTVVLAGGNAPTGAVSFTLPVTSINYAGTSTLPIIGDAKYFISSAYRGSIVWVNNTTARFVVDKTDGTYSTDANISATVPASFTNGSELHAHGWYEAA